MAGLLGEVYSYIDSKKRGLLDAFNNPGDALQQFFGNMGDNQNQTNALMQAAGYGLLGKPQTSVLADSRPSVGYDQNLRAVTPQQTALARALLAEQGSQMGLAGTIGGKFVYPQEEALATAQRNASLPKRQGGLGLHSANTPAERAQAMGFEDAFHGTASDIQQIDPTQFGAATGAQSAKQAFWAASDPTTAAGYADYAANAAPVRALIKQADVYERLAQKGGNSKTWWDKYDKVLEQADQLESDVAKNPLRGQNVMPLSINTSKAKSADAAGAEFVDMEGGVNGLLRDAKRSKKDVAVLQNLADDVGRNGRPTTHFGVLNPSAIRSRFAAFDPMRRDSPDILAGMLPLSMLADDDQRSKLMGLLGTK